ncbi:MAG TPA: response regulator transcription factor [Nocardioidaceae bacterium]|nr:response regulator transcription factor [Nocardioidaceae bacterium]
MPPPGEAAPVITLALTHPMRAWVQALEMLLEPRWDIEVVAAHTSPQWVRHTVLNGQASVLLTHLQPPVNGLSGMLEGLFAANPRLSVVALSDSEDPALVCAAVRAGVRGWVEPTASVEHLVRVLHGVAAGETWFPPRLTTVVLESLLESAQTRERATAVVSSLSAREIEVLGCLARGLTRQQIADQYFLSPHTVRTHINNVLRKLDVHSTLAAVSIARQIGLTDAVPEQRHSS